MNQKDLPWYSTAYQ